MKEFYFPIRKYFNPLLLKFIGRTRLRTCHRYLMEKNQTLLIVAHGWLNGVLTCCFRKISSDDWVNILNLLVVVLMSNSCICWKWAEIFTFWGFFFIFLAAKRKLDLLYIVGCSVQTKKLINTTVRISVLLGQKRQLWFIWFQIKV